MKRVAVLSKYGSRAASTRQRFLQYRDILAANGIRLDIHPLLDNDYLDKRLGAHGKPIAAALSGYAQRARHLVGGIDADAVIVHCEVFPYLPGALENLLLRVRQPLIYDFDDAIFHQYDAHRRPLVRRMLGGKLAPLLSRMELAICGNAYLEDYAARYCKRTAIVPTVVDVDAYRPVADRDPDARPVLGWIGSPSTWTYMRPHAPMLSRLAAELDFRILVVGAGPQDAAIPGFDFVDWTEETEIASIQAMDIGIMPLPDEPWARGKCGYKLIQYMACGLPVVASPVGVNSEIVTDGVNGFLARGEDEWSAAIRRLVEDPALRRSLGREGRRTVEERYSLQVHGPRLADLLGQV